MNPGRRRASGACFVLILDLVGLLGLSLSEAHAQSPAGSPRPAGAAAQGPVAGVEPATGPGGLGLERVEGLQGTVLGIPAWQYLAAFAYIVLAYVASRLVDWLIRNQLRKLALKSSTQVDDAVLEISRRPLKIAVFVALLHVGLKALSWPAWAAGFFSGLLKGAVGVTLAYLAFRFVDVGMEVWQRRAAPASSDTAGAQLLPVVRKSLRVFVVIVASIVTLQNVGMDVTGLLASLSIGGLALGLAAQDTLANLFGAVALFADRPFHVGDRIQLDAIDGTVEAIGLRSTRIRNLDGFLVTVPNRTMANASLTNVSHRPSIKTEMNIGVTYDTPAEKVERAMEIIDGVYRPHPKTVDLIVSFNRFEASSLNILVVHWWGATDVKEYLANFRQLNLELKRLFDREGIEFAFPTRTIHLKQDPQ